MIRYHCPAAVFTAACFAVSSAVGTSHAKDVSNDVVQLFRAAYAERCATAKTGGFLEYQPPEVHKINFNYAYENENDPEQVLSVYNFLCDRGAYNEMRVFLVANSYDEIEPVQFAEPELRIEYENDDTEGAVRDIRIRGMVARDILVNAYYDPDTQKITSHSKWRGLGDASSSGVWRFHAGNFILESYDVDASYDGEINLRTLLDFSAEWSR